MLNLAISIDTDADGIDIVETNRGDSLKAPDWPRDCEFQMVAYRPSERICDVVVAHVLAEDIGHAIRALREAGMLQSDAPDWYMRLAHYAAGARSLEDAR
jgi:hypothetical protein